MKMNKLSFIYIGENVKEFFFRAVALTFEAAILREIDTSSDGPTKQIGNDLISKYWKVFKGNH